MIQSPRKTEIQSDGRIRKWGWIKEETKFLRVILLEDGETFHNAFFDRPIDLDGQGNLVSMTIEHARANARPEEFSFQPCRLG
ncbi:hypothetical protein [Desulfoferrobacter suflitae]|uniref:hypothetical protein n=1 Tax=Desulfoferrobacter suflitae TaxID=2865782 RepID=UPI0021641C70|nr:hypothetical protein [Desulfoferrobacter suflitae]MCK8603951.1 hypothetical protein [Desulfoferrobacter suflitae]